MTALAAHPTNFGPAWTPAEDAILREHYPLLGIAKTAAMVGRSRTSVAHRARRLGLSRRRRWTDAERRRLRMLWGEMSVARIAKAMGRTEATIFWHAQQAGLPIGVQPGMESPRAAARRTGFDWSTLKQILAWAGVESRRTMSRPIKQAGYRFRQLDVVDVDDAIERWMACETVNAAAERHGVSGDALAEWLVASGDPEIPPRPPRKHRWRVPSEVVDRVVAERRQLESLAVASKRVGLDRSTLAKWLRRAGVKPRGVLKWQINPADVDALMANLTPRQRSYAGRGKRR